MHHNIECEGHTWTLLSRRVFAFDSDDSTFQHPVEEEWRSISFLFFNPVPLE